MPNRILRDWTDSLKFDGISAEAERLFCRLLMKADDFGRYHANARLLKSGCFPLAEDLRAHTVAAWLTELSDRHLVCCYTSGTGEYLSIINFRQRLKQSVPKFPPRPGKDRNWMPDDNDFRELPGTSRNLPEHPARARGDGDGDGDGDEQSAARAREGGFPEQANPDWDIAKYVDAYRRIPGLGACPDASIKNALDAEPDPHYRAAAWNDWVASVLGATELPRSPVALLRGYMRKARTAPQAFRPTTGTTLTPITDNTVIQ